MMMMMMIIIIIIMGRNREMLNEYKVYGKITLKTIPTHYSSG